LSPQETKITVVIRRTRIKGRRNLFIVGTSSF
jgi:hypothetical protein